MTPIATPAMDPTIAPAAKRTLRRSRRRSILRRGVATVEFAFCASIVFLMFMTMVEFTRFHVVRHSLDQAVYLGARTGIVPGATAGEVNQAVVDRLAAAGVMGATVSITPAVITSETDTITVNATAPYNDNSWSMPKFFDGIDVTAEITLDHENTAFN